MPRQSRIALLSEKVRTAEGQIGRETESVPFMGQMIPLTKIRLEIDFPRYNIRSGRSPIAQSEYLDLHPELPSDFFADPEDSAVQEAQHQILLGMIHDEDLAEDLELRGQRAPLVLTFDGFVVNGNRRLAALRDQEEQFVEACVLPADARVEDLYQTELEFQMAPDTKAPYHWIAEALHVKFGIEELNLSVGAVANSMRNTVRTINSIINSLNYVDMFLDWSGEPPENYHKIPPGSTGDAKQGFGDIVRGLNRESVRNLPQEEQRAIREACFAVIKEQGGYQAVRNIINAADSNPDSLVDRAIERFPADFTIEEIPQEEGDTVAAPDNLIARVAGAEPQPTTNPARITLQRIAREVQVDRLTGQVLSGAASDVREEQRERERLDTNRRRLVKALNELSAVRLDRNTDNREEIAQLTEQIITETERLTNNIQELWSD